MEQAKGKVFIENGKVVAAEEPKVEWCPLHDLVYGKKIIHTKEFIKEHVRMKIQKVGMFTENRIVESDEDLVPFGASEMLMCAQRNKIIDCAVLACDCAGTVIATTPKLIQGIGGWLAGLVKTSPIEAVIQRLQKAGAVVVDPAEANIDQLAGVKRAFELGYQKVAVTLSGEDASLLPQIREIEKENNGSVIILMVHNTGVDVRAAELMVEYADMVWACASKAVWEVVGPEAKLQIGIAIPVFVLSERGKEIVENRAATINRRDSIYTENLPRMVEAKCPCPLI